MKVCTKCGKAKPVSEFSHDRTKKDGLKTRCKECMHEDNAEYREARKADKAKRLKEEKKRLKEAKKSLITSVREKASGSKAVAAKPCTCKKAADRKKEIRLSLVATRIILAVAEAIAASFGLRIEKLELNLKGKK